MNVAFDPWIPVVNTSGKRELSTLSAILCEGEQFADLAVRPHERVALMRLLLCVAHAALEGPKDYGEWRQVPKRLPEAARKYLENWEDSFELFDTKKPWLQVAELSNRATGNMSLEDGSSWTPVSKLNFSFATGNASTLFDHEGMASQKREIQLHDIALALLTFQCFSVGGLIGQVFWNGVLCGELSNIKKKKSPVKSSDGPCVPSSMLHAFLRGRTILQTLWLNMPNFDDVCFTYEDMPIGKPIWELIPTSLEGCPNTKNATETYIGRLVPMTRVIRLHPSEKCMLLGNGLTYRSFANGFPQEPTATVIKIQDKRVLLSYRPTKAIWRDLAAIVVRRTAEGTGGPLSLRSIQDGEGCDLIVAALARDKATIVDTIESNFTIPSRMVSGDVAGSYDCEVKEAERLATRLGWAVEMYREEVDHGWEGRLKSAGPAKGKLKARLYEQATTHYWTAAEKNLSLLMAHIEAMGTDDAVPTRNVWRKMLFQSACDAYRISCGQNTPRQMRAFAKGWQTLTMIKNKSQSKKNGSKEGRS